MSCFSAYSMLRHEVKRRRNENKITFSTWLHHYCMYLLLTMSVDPSVAMRWVTMETSRSGVLASLVAVTLTSRPEVAFPKRIPRQGMSILGF